MVKGTKFLTPADKARKEARKKELKKNKKQRQQVRSAAIEKKDPEQVISDLEKLDRLEFDIDTNPTLSDNLYKDKRKRLMETWSKILVYYEKEDPDKYQKLKKIESEYGAKHRKLAKDFEAIKAAQDLKIEDVFLPPESSEPDNEIADDDPLLSDSVYITPLSEGLKPPGCPPGLPPDLRKLVESLKTSLVNQFAQETQTIPLNLINLHSSQNANLSTSSRGLNYRKIDPDRNRNEHPRLIKNQPTHTRSGLTKNTKFQPPVNPANSAVIESQPVIFKPKVTKFVPSSVRSKITKQEK